MENTNGFQNMVGKRTEIPTQFSSLDETLSEEHYRLELQKVDGRTTEMVFRSREKDPKYRLNSLTRHETLSEEHYRLELQQKVDGRNTPNGFQRSMVAGKGLKYRLNSLH
ncbi:hypothetical protein AVEN_134819-1 [Araneus ventricosus]|uniref:Uncharacterized protein n=1 Tax=Araneus ventricosus TaxID=182803 RepID=A0A4Y2JDZ2_ARAVE|nr:hypothetical protein AVEN_134819-1 [Araneus ventricosus]